VAGNFASLWFAPQHWWRVLVAVYAASDKANLPLIAAGVAFFGVLAAIPGLAAVVTLVGLLGDPDWVGEQIKALRGVAPDAAMNAIHVQAMRLLQSSKASLLPSAVFNTLLALWSALQGTRWTLLALAAVNQRTEERGFFRRYLAAALFTAYGVGLSVFAILIIGVAPMMLPAMSTTSEEVLLIVLRWLILGGGAFAIAVVLYRWGPGTHAQPWRSVWPGAVLAPSIWVLASTGLSLILHEFPAFGAAYGSLASAVTLLLWLYLTAFVFLLGGALNAELEALACTRNGGSAGGN